MTRKALAIILAAILPGLLVAGCSSDNPATSPTGNQASQATSRLLIDLAGQQKELLTDSQGTLPTDVEASSAGAEIKIGLTRGAQALDAKGAPLQTIQAVVEPNPPTPPADSYLIGRAYSLRPAGASFKPWLDVTLSYSSKDLPQGVTVADLGIAYYETAWRFTDFRRVDAYSVTTHLDRLATLAIMAKKSPSTPTVTSPPVSARRGNTAPDFLLTDTGGKDISLAALRGKPVVINFWATWCGYCVEEMPLLEQFYRKWSVKGVEFMAIDVDEDAPTVRGFVQKKGLTFPVLLDTRSATANKYNIGGLPTTYFIDPNGIIRELKVGAFANLAEIENLVKKIVPER